MSLISKRDDDGSRCGFFISADLDRDEIKTLQTTAALCQETTSFIQRFLFVLISFSTLCLCVILISGNTKERQQKKTFLRSKRTRGCEVEGTSGLL